ncbi:N-acetylneuraminate synthase family protein, partial [Methylophilaceae bacterium]|nr:N-acetylneuraminate synthase family protein [Methylophilaceae bacterium]
MKLWQKKNKPTLIATGASNEKEVIVAVNRILKHNSQLCLMQCNTNYTASLDNFKYINLNVLKRYRALFPHLVLGLSDHTPDHATVLGAVTLGARMIEKHFTDNNDLEGPDHKFSMNPSTWSTMVERTRELEYALGSEEKKIEKNEINAAVVQRRSLRANKDLKKGDKFSLNSFEPLRP